MNEITTHIFINLVISILIALAFMGFIHKLNKKKYFLSGIYLSAIIAFCTLLIMFIINVKKQ